jgi:hypothetical protein
VQSGAACSGLGLPAEYTQRVVPRSTGVTGTAGGHESRCKYMAWSTCGASASEARVGTCTTAQCCQHLRHAHGRVEPASCSGSTGKECWRNQDYLTASAKRAQLVTCNSACCRLVTIGEGQVPGQQHQPTHTPLETTMNCTRCDATAVPLFSAAHAAHALTAAPLRYDVQMPQSAIL